MTFFSVSLKAQVWGVQNSRTEDRPNAGLRGDAGAKSGFYQTDNPSNFPNGAQSWWHLLDVRHSNPANNYAMQFAGSFFDQNLFFRKTTYNASQPWFRVLTQNSDGILMTDRVVTQTSGGQSFFVGHKAGGGYVFPDGIFHAITDNGANNFYYDGVTAGTRNFYVRADGQGYFAGKIGIGTSSPNALLDVGGDISNGILGTVFGRMPEGNNQGSGTFLGVRGYATQGNDITNVKSFAIEHSFYGVVNSSINFLRGTGMNGGSLTFNTNDNSERMRINPTGDLAIGTTDSHGYKLAVNGSIRSKEVKVEAGPWPDYVFKPAYRLLALSEVKAYVEKNQHLPEMPSIAGKPATEFVNHFYDGYLSKNPILALITFMSLCIFCYVVNLLVDNRSPKTTLSEDGRRDIILTKLKKYYEALLDEKNNYDINFQIDLNLEFTNVNIPRNIIKNYLIEGFEKTTIKDVNTFVYTYLRKLKRIVVIGDHGSGKSILLLKIAIKSIEVAQHDTLFPIPIILDFASWESWTSRNVGDFKRFLRNNLFRKFKEIDLL